jgi:hypothetical protein
MISTEHGIQIIECDKCGVRDCCKEEIAGRYFFNKGWGVNRRANTHLCRDCQRSREKHMTSWGPIMEDKTSQLIYLIVKEDLNE